VTVELGLALDREPAVVEAERVGARVVPALDDGAPPPGPSRAPASPSPPEPSPQVSSCAAAHAP
jgi:hypothetical protein